MKANLKCSFIVPGYKCDEFITRNIESILDQDYKNYEIIVVLNGEWNTRKDLFQSLKEKYSDKIQLHWIPQGHLGKANNFGLTKATGDIVSHLSSDLYLMPGSLRTWVDAFNEHPDCGLVYSGYKLVSHNPMDVYYSDAWDRYHLECENFIDGANPYRREKAVRWDEELKSLIDWDWVLSLTDNGLKGCFIKEPLYFAELPKAGGLSVDSTNFWKIRRKEIQKKHNIPYDRKICITSLVDPVYALEIAKMIDADFRGYPSHKPHDYTLIYQYGFMCDIERIQTSVGVFAKHWNHKVIHWIGLDIRTLMNLAWKDVDYFVQMGLKNIQTNFCISKKDQQVLKRMHIEAELIYPPIRWDFKKEVSDGISVNDAELKYQLEKAMPDQIIKVNDLNCPITIHFDDSMINVLKSICMGNMVITEKFIPSTYHIQSYSNVPELRKMIVHTIRQIQKQKPEVNDEDLKEYRENTTPNHFKRKLEKIMEKKVSKYAKLEDIQPAIRGTFGVGEAEA